MTNIISSLAPVFLLIVTGYFLKRFKFLGARFWGSASKLTYYVLFPALLINTLVFTDLEQEYIQPLVVSLGVPILVISIILIAVMQKTKIGRYVAFDGPTFSSIFKGSIRPNTFVTLAIIMTTFGEQGLMLAAIAIATLVPLANLLSIIALSRYVKKNAPTPSAQMITIFTNPLLIACILGLALNIGEITIPIFSQKILKFTGDAAIVLGLMCVGAALKKIQFQRDSAPIIIASTLKLIIFPLITFWLLKLYQINDELVISIALFFAATPSSATGYVMARELGGNSSLMAKIISFQTILASITMPGIFFFLLV